MHIASSSAGKNWLNHQGEKNAFSVTRFKQRLEEIQRKLAIWVSGVPAREKTAQSMMHRLGQAIKSKKILEADAIADEILNRILRD
jgi:hypothetical protein